MIGWGGRTWLDASAVQCRLCTFPHQYHHDCDCDEDDDHDVMMNMIMIVMRIMIIMLPALVNLTATTTESSQTQSLAYICTFYFLWSQKKPLKVLCTVQPFDHLSALSTTGLFLKSVFLQDPDQTARANEGGPRFAQEPPQHDDAPLGVQALGA